MIKVKVDFDVDKIMKDVKKQALAEMKSRFSTEINSLASGTGEHPKIVFTPKGDSSLDVKVEGVSDELKSKIDNWLQKQK